MPAYRVNRPQGVDLMRDTDVSNEANFGRRQTGLDGRATRAGTPGGVTTNGASAPNKPNLPWGDLGGKCCTDKELRQLDAGAAPGRTKPISRGRPCLGIGRRSVPPVGPVAQTNPIGGRRGRGLSCQTKPIRRLWKAGSPGQVRKRFDRHVPADYLWAFTVAERIDRLG